MAANPKQIEQELENLEKSIVLLKRDYEIYFAGASRTPPNDQRDKLDKLIKRMGITQGMSYAQRFKYNAVVARFNSYLDLWSKQLRMKEEGRSSARVTGLTTSEAKRVVDEAHKAYARSERPKEPPPDPMSKVYEQYLRTREGQGEGTSNMSFEGFAKVVGKQREAILQKFQCKDVEFYVTVEQGHAKLKARPIK